MTITTTLNRIREHSPCKEGWSKLLKHLGKTQADDEPLPYSVIVASNGLDDALWCCRAEPQHASIWRHFAVDCAEDVRHLMTDERSLRALEVARRHADGLATDVELVEAWRAACDAASHAASHAASYVANYTAIDAAWQATWHAAWRAASSVARAVASNMPTGPAAREKQTERFLRYVS